ncbi:MAG: NAD(P)/FAD-dependent oxidoreductase [Steroidobacteraceae bacterium]
MAAIEDSAHSNPRILIVGGGFGGLAVARALAGTPARVTLVDQRNHHVFQPLLYQVATAWLSPADISAPIRTVLKRQENCEVVLAAVTGIDLAGGRLQVGSEWIGYDVLVLAAGATHAYFGHPEWAAIAPGLKSIEDATDVRRRILLAFESAEHEGDADERRAALTFAVVGAGPTGVELAGEIREIAAHTLPREYRHIDTRSTRVLLFEGGPRLLPAMRPAASARALRDLQKLGVEVRLNALVTGLSPGFIEIGNERIAARNVFWAAGVRASPLGAQLGVPLDRAGRVVVGPDLAIPGHPDVFVVGDMAAATSAENQRPVPGVAQGALQMGAHVGRTIAARMAGKPAPEAFRYRDRGSMAVIGKSRAVAQIGRFEFGGFFAWLLWGVVHIMALVGFRNRAQVALSWLFSWLVNSRDARLITGEARLEVRAPRRDE